MKRAPLRAFVHFVVSPESKNLPRLVSRVTVYRQGPVAPSGLGFTLYTAEAYASGYIISPRWGLRGEVRRAAPYRRSRIALAVASG